MLVSKFNCAICLLFLICQLSVVQMDPNDYTVSIASNYTSDLGEGPFYDPRSDTLYYVDAFKGTVISSPLDARPKERHVITDKLVSLVIPYASDDSSFLITVRSTLAKYSWKNRKFETLASLPTHSVGDERFNDGKCDSAGRLFVGSVVESKNGDGPILRGAGSIYRLEGNRLVNVASGFTLSNGMDWSVSGEIFYFNDSEDQKIYVFDYNPKVGTLSNKRVFIDVKSHKDFKTNEYPDGLMVDANDFIWTALYAGGRVVKINPRTAQVVSSIQFPASKVTSLTFGGSNLDAIYVTSSHSESEKDSGKIYKITSQSNSLRGKGFAHKFSS